MKKEIYETLKLMLQLYKSYEKVGAMLYLCNLADYVCVKYAMNIRSNKVVDYMWTQLPESTKTKIAVCSYTDEGICKNLPWWDFESPERLEFLNKLVTDLRKELKDEQNS